MSSGLRTGKACPTASPPHAGAVPSPVFPSDPPFSKPGARPARREEGGGIEDEQVAAVPVPADLLRDDLDQGAYHLHRIDASRLFFPTDERPPRVGAGAEAKDARLPQPGISFNGRLAPNGVMSALTFFAPFGRGGKKSLIAGADEEGSTVLYDLDKRAVRHDIRLNEPKDMVDPVSLALGDALCVMDRSPRPESRCGFEALAYDTEGEDGRPVHDWRWICLQPPPYVLEPDYKPTPISSYTVVGGTNIWISTPGIGTYSLDTVAGRWSRAGKWVLPFCDRATYFPEYGSWLGFAPQSRLLCASDLSAASKSNKPSSVLLLEEEEEDVQQLRQELELESPGRTSVTDSYLVHLGSAKFCVAKFFLHEYYNRGEQLRSFAVLTGCVMDPDSRPLRMTKHKARRYEIPPLCKGWVF